MMAPDDQIALIDLDGTTADYDRAMVVQLKLLRSPLEDQLESIPYGEVPTWLEARMDLIKRQTGFWRDLPPIPLGLEICRFLQNRGFRLMVLSKGPRRTTSAWTEKVEWAQTHLPDADITITYDKGLSYGKVLFDDYPPYIERWLQHRPRGKVLMLDNVYNSDFKHPNVLRITRQLELSPEIGNRIWHFIKGGAG